MEEVRGVLGGGGGNFPGRESNLYQLLQGGRSVECCRTIKKTKEAGVTGSK